VDVPASWQRYGVQTPHCSILENARGGRQYFFTGVVLIICQGQNDWCRGTVQIPLRIPHLAPDQAIAVSGAAPFVSLSSVAIDSEGHDVGFAVDGFRLAPFSEHERQYGVTVVTIESDIAVRANAGFVYRVGYQLALVGTPVGRAAAAATGSAA
jgi:hypothetical protein